MLKFFVKISYWSGKVRVKSRYVETTMNDCAFKFFVDTGSFFGHFWHKRSALQSVAVRQSTGNDVSGHYFHKSFYFSFLHFSVVPFFHRRSAPNKITKE